jgi:hypothetical protein
MSGKEFTCGKCGSTDNVFTLLAHAADTAGMRSLLVGEIRFCLRNFPIPSPKRFRVDGEEFATLTAEGMGEYIAEGLPMKERELALAVQGQSYGPMFDEKLTVAAWKTSPHGPSFPRRIKCSLRPWKNRPQRKWARKRLFSRPATCPSSRSRQRSRR